MNQQLTNEFILNLLQRFFLLAGKAIPTLSPGEKVLNERHESLSEHVLLGGEDVFFVAYREASDAAKHEIHTFEILLRTNTNFLAIE